MPAPHAWRKTFSRPYKGSSRRLFFFFFFNPLVRHELLYRKPMFLLFYFMFFISNILLWTRNDAACFFGQSLGYAGSAWRSLFVCLLFRNFHFIFTMRILVFFFCNQGSVMWCHESVELITRFSLINRGTRLKGCVFQSSRSQPSFLLLTFWLSSKKNKSWIAVFYTRLKIPLG